MQCRRHEKYFRGGPYVYNLKRSHHGSWEKTMIGKINPPSPSDYGTVMLSFENVSIVKKIKFNNSSLLHEI